MKLEDTKIRNASDSLSSRTPRTNRVSLFLEGLRDEIVYLGIEQLVSYKHQARITFDNEELSSLASTIKEVGIRQPLTVLPNEEDKYEIISGERRYRAAKLAGLDRVPCIIVKDKNQAESIALIENIQRADLTPLELGEALSGLLERKVFASQSDIADKLGIQRSKVVECISLSKLNKEVKDALTSKKMFSRDKLRNLLSLGTFEEQLKYVNSSMKDEDIANQKTDNNKKNLSSQLSLIRISMVDNDLKLQKKRLKMINYTQKERLKTLLLEIINELN